MVWAVKGSSDINPSFSESTIHALDYVEGSASSTVLIVEYSDFQCPACRTYYSAVKELMAEFGDKVALVYRDFPLIEIHANSELAARAARAAGKQGKFWEMHNLLFEKQAEWSTVANIEPLFESYASLLGISVDQFKIDFRSKEIMNFVKAERSHAIKIKLQGTPTFFVNGEQIQNPSSTESFKAIIQAAIKNKQ